MAHLLLALIFVYQKTLSRALYALFGPICRFEPSCSKYAAACLRSHGALRGSLLSIRRVSRCHPFHPGGWDPPPPPRGSSPPLLRPSVEGALPHPGTAAPSPADHLLANEGDGPPPSVDAPGGPSRSKEPS